MADTISIEQSARHPLVERAVPLERIDVIAAATIGVITVVIAIAWRSVLISTDPWHYVQAALGFPPAADSWNLTGLTRWGIILPTGLVSLVLRNSQGTYYFWAIAGSATLMACTYLIGARLVNRLVGAVGALILLLLPVVLINLTRIYPDLLSTALVALALLLAIVASERAFDRRTSVLLIACGLAVGWAFEVRETAVFAFPALLVPLLRLRPWPRVGLLVGVPAVAWLVLDLVLNRLLYGDALAKVRTLLGSNLGAASGGVAADNAYLGKSRIGYLLEIPRAMLAYPGGWWMLLVTVAGLVALVVWHRRMLALLVWAGLVIGLFVLQGGVLRPAAPSVRLDIPRYWIAFFPPVAIGIAAGAFLLGAWILSRRGMPSGGRLPVALACALFVPALLVGGRFLATNPSLAPNGGDSLEQLRSYVAANGGTLPVVWTDWQSKRILPAYERTPWGTRAWTAGQVKSLTGKDQQKRSGDYVLIVSPDRDMCGFCRAEVNNWLKANPGARDAWTRVWTSTSGDVTLYRVP